MAASAAGAFMGGQIVQDDEVAGLKGGGELGFDVSLEDAPIHRRVDDEWRGERAAAQAGDEGLRLPMAERDLGKKAFGLLGNGRAGGSSWSAVEGGSGLVEEDQPMRLKPHLRLAISRSIPRAPGARRADLFQARGKVLWNGPPVLPAS